MTDLEATKLCAEAMGWTCRDIRAEYGRGTDRIYRVFDGDEPIYGIGSDWITARWDPLLDDAQAMALVKKLGLTCITELGQGRALWRVHHWRESGHAYHPNLNRAIVMCVAAMQCRPISQGAD